MYIIMCVYHFCILHHELFILYQIIWPSKIKSVSHGLLASQWALMTLSAYCKGTFTIAQWLDIKKWPKGLCLCACFKVYWIKQVRGFEGRYIYKTHSFSPPCSSHWFVIHSTSYNSTIREFKELPANIQSPLWLTPSHTYITVLQLSTLKALRSSNTANDGSGWVWFNFIYCFDNQYHN